MKIALNIIWLVLAGFWLFVGYVIAGIIHCIFIVTIPFGVQAFKLAGYALWPFGRMVVHRPDRDVALGCLGNVLWFVFGGFWLALAPFGKIIVPVGSVPAGSTPVVSVPIPRG